MMNLKQYYKLFETDNGNGAKRMFLHQYNGDVVEVRKVTDHSTGREALILEPDVALGIRMHLDGISNSDFNRDWVLEMPDPIWERMPLGDPKIKVVELCRIPSLLPERFVAR